MEPNTRPHYWGYQALFDCADCDREKITDPEFLSNWVKGLVKDIAMVPYGEPQVLHFGHNQEHLSGWTVLQFIETSNVLAHFNDHTGEGYIDVFSCMPFDLELAKQNIRRAFDPKTIRVNYITRQA